MRPPFETHDMGGSTRSTDLAEEGVEEEEVVRERGRESEGETIVGGPLRRRGGAHPAGPTDSSWTRLGSRHGYG
jgi:hypothetical protein